MARHPIQLQPGLSLPAYLEHYGTEAQCKATLYQYRWPDCGNTTEHKLAREV